MVEPEGGTYVLSAAEVNQIGEKYGDYPPEPEEFLPDPIESITLQQNFGIRDPQLPDFDLTGSTTFT